MSILVPLFDEIDRWMNRGPEWYEIQPGSSLAGDDAATDPHQLSHLVVHAISVAVDHLHCLRTVIGNAGVLHLYAPYGLLRPAIEGGLIGVWLLEPASRKVRTTRCLRLANQDVIDSEEIKDILKSSDSPDKDVDLAESDTGLTREQRINRIRGIAQRQNLDVSAVLGRHGAEGMVRTAAEAAAPGVGDAAAVLWKVCSGITHVRTFAMLSTSNLEEISRTAGNVVNAHVTANEDRVILAINIAAAFVRKAIQLFENRATCHR
jgi:hypothetical protein